MIKNDKSSLALLIALNLLPIWGVLQWGWTPFMVFYLFWIETLIISVFNALKIIFCRGEEFETRLEVSSHKLAEVHVKYGSHLRKAFTYLVVRIFVFLFYLLFIVVFIGFVIADDADKKEVFNTLAFINKSFNYALLGFILHQAIQFIFNFILNDEYKSTHASDFAAIFDGRQIIIHVAVVLSGVFGGFYNGAFTDKEPGTFPHKMVIYLFAIGVFCVVKTLFEVMKYKGITQKMTVRK